MSSDIPTTTASFEKSTDLRATLDQARIDYLDSGESKIVVMWGTAVLVIETDSRITDCETADIRLFDAGNRPPDETEQETLDRFVDILGEAANQD